MRDHSTRSYNKKKVTRYRTKSAYKVSGREDFQRNKASILPHKLAKPYEGRG